MRIPPDPVAHLHSSTGASSPRTGDGGAATSWTHVSRRAAPSSVRPRRVARSMSTSSRPEAAVVDRPPRSRCYQRGDAGQRVVPDDSDAGSPPGPRQRGVAAPAGMVRSARAPGDLGAPAVLLAPLAGVGRLSADGLVLWAPVTTGLAVGRVLAHGECEQPMR